MSIGTILILTLPAFGTGVVVGTIIAMYIMKQKLSRFGIEELEVDEDTEKTLEDLKEEIKE